MLRKDTANWLCGRILDYGPELALSAGQVRAHSWTELAPLSSTHLFASLSPSFPLLSLPHSSPFPFLPLCLNPRPAKVLGTLEEEAARALIACLTPKWAFNSIFTLVFCHRRSIYIALIFFFAIYNLFNIVFTLVLLKRGGGTSRVRADDFFSLVCFVRSVLVVRSSPGFKAPATRAPTDEVAIDGSYNSLLCCPLVYNLSAPRYRWNFFSKLEVFFFRIF